MNAPAKLASYVSRTCYSHLSRRVYLGLVSSLATRLARRCNWRPLAYVRLCPLNISFVDGPKFAACCLGFSQQLGAASLESRQHLVMI
jgi:hypothetical protein